MTLNAQKWLLVGSEFARHRITVDWFALGVGSVACMLLAIAWYAVATTPFVVSIPPGAAGVIQQGLTLAAVPPSKNYTFQDFAEINARPIFTPARRPPPKRPDPVSTPTVTSAPPPPLIGYWTVVGIAIWPDQKIALLHSANGSTETASVGERIGGWRVVGIAPDHVVFRYQKKEQTLRLTGPDPQSDGPNHTRIMVGPRIATTPGSSRSSPLSRPLGMSN